MNLENKAYNSAVIVGTMRLGVWGVKMNTNELERFIDECVEMGATDFDHADIYGFYTEEEEFGAVLKRRKDLRSKIKNTTKCGIKLICDNRSDHKIKSYDSSKKHILSSAEQSLKYLGVEALDILLLHRPDYLMDPHAVAEAFEELKSKGKVKQFGVSNFSPSQFDLLHSFTPLVTNQVEISVLHRNAFQDGTLDQCIKKGIQPSAWSPFGGGALFSSSEDENILAIKKVVNELAEKHECKFDQLLMAWLKKHPSDIVPVLGTTKASRIQDAINSKSIKLSQEEWYEIWQAAIGTEVA